MQSALNMWCFPDAWTFQEACQYASENGVHALEVNLSETGSFQLKASTDTWREARHLAEDYGVAIPSVSTSLLWTYPLTDARESVREQARDVVLRMIELAGTLGADTVLVVPGLVTQDVSYEHAYDRAQEACAQLAATASGTGVTIAIENVWNRFLLSPLEFKRFIDEIDHPQVQVYLDVGNVLPNGFPEQWIRALAHRIRRVHVKDFRKEIGNISGFTTLFRGDVNWTQVLCALKEIGYDEYLTAEIPPNETYPKYTIEETIRGLGTLCGMYDQIQQKG